MLCYALHIGPACSTTASGTSHWQDLQHRVGMVTTAWSSYWIIGIQGTASFVNVPVAGIFVDINILAVTFNMLNN